MRFEGDNEIHYILKSDDNMTTYDAPQWVDGDDDGLVTSDPQSGDKNYPISFKRKSNPKIGGKFKALGLPSGQTLKIKATAPNLEIEETLVTADSNGIIDLQAEPVTGDFVDFIKLYNADDNTAFKIDWKIKIGSNGWMSIGSTKHTVYLTLDKPKTSLRQETLFEIGCRRANDDQDTNSARTKTYSEFQTRQVKRVSDQMVLTYWGSTQQVGAMDTTELLAIGDGNCNAWAQFFMDTLGAQGIQANMCQIVPIIIDTVPYLTPFDKKRLAVNEWVFSGNGAMPNPYPYTYTTDANPGDAGTAAQNNDAPPKLFNTHWVASSGGALYDPSYGTEPVTGGPKEYEDQTFAGFGKLTTINNLNVILLRKNDKHVVSFSEIEVISYQNP